MSTPFPPSAALPTTTQAAPRRWPALALPGWRQLWFQLHWLVGITAGSVLVLIGVSGALLTFREELLDLFNPGVRQVAPQATPALTPEQLLQALSASHPGQRVASLTLEAAPGTAARVGLAPPPGQRRGETLYLHPYTGAVQPPLRGHAAFEWIESLHRWLLLPREPGRVAAGVLALCLLGLSLSGLYLRWPRRVGDWRSWLALDWRRKGRSFLWSLHAVAGTWVLLLYVLLTLTGLYWAFDSVRSAVDGWAGQPRSRQAAPAPSSDGGNPLQLDRAWQRFGSQAPDWSQAILRLPQRAGQPLQIQWRSADAPHERARHRMLLAGDGQVTTDDRYEDRSTGARALSTIYPLHMGSYFGLPGRILVTVASLALPLFAITGWMLYLGRRRQKRATQAARAQATAACAPSTNSPAGPPLLVAYASQAGQAERLALQTATALQQAGLAAQARSLQQLAPADLAAFGQVLLVASSFGEGEPPDAARRFARLLDAAPAHAPLSGLRYAVLALGDRSYAQFCAFGHTLDVGLQRWGAQPLFPLIEVDNGDTAALQRWQQALATLDGAAALAASTALAPAEAATFTPWRLVQREQLNPGSLGGALFELQLQPADGTLPDWAPGALVEVLPQQAPATVQAWLAAAALDGDSPVQHGGQTLTLATLLASSQLPAPQAGPSAQAWAAQLQPLAPRSYSVASVTADGSLQLLVRQERHAIPDHPALGTGLGLASGWLTAHLPTEGTVQLRLLDNPRFGLDGVGDAPCLFLGNGSGLAGLRGHLRQRVRDGQHANWLVFGERQQAHDRLCAAEIEGWQAQGALQRLDRCFSRDADSPQRYVQDVLRAVAPALRAWLDRGAVVFVCGSAQGMAAGVDAVLLELLGTEGVDALLAAGRYRRDVY